MQRHGESRRVVHFDQNHVTPVTAILTPSGFGEGPNGALSREHRKWRH